MPSRRAVLAAASLAALPARAQAPWAPDGPVRLIQGFAPGGTTDIVARLLAPSLAAALGQPVVVENRPGAGGTLAAEALARARPDGRTMMMLNNAFAVTAATFRRLPYDPLAEVVPVSQVATMPLVFLTPPTGPLTSVAALVEAAKARPGALNLGTVGVGSTQHFVAEAFQAMAGVKLTHVPYRGTPAAVLALRQGEVQLVVETVAAVLGQIRAGEARAIALSTAQRFPGLPEVPTMREAGLAEFDLATWFTLAFPAGIPPAAVARVQAETARALADPDLAARMREMGLTPVGSDAATASSVIRRDIQRWRDLVVAAGIPQQEQ
ncbi:tripartite tricarboxylate transporter substrate-binding protein [Neoroseomonas oryzicola]|uniref:Tripartite tricarboxylate transporter substrate binding protein n=1 Tax=Neoroseomonas oryzicola TaxID=535904 RepID=A0A9X9WD43_9PROT|nr:tripartite tricarboxylate transporter substrate-binding protein [Neoroseomonas oryzicola]MBR0658253.1 tripartite tricarboxylate transporter substrate binding protein [Neoroseomonas oryzicola]NKE15930.1 tripartite tricarboxylate transporter substrate binding protein [Neoroseomonas oryzicola]